MTKEEKKEVKKEPKKKEEVKKVEKKEEKKVEVKKETKKVEKKEEKKSYKINGVEVLSTEERELNGREYIHVVLADRTTQLLTLEEAKSLLK